MIVVLDSNHYGEMVDDTPRGQLLSRRLETERPDVFTTIVTIQEVTQGWLAEINRRKPGSDQLHPYAQFFRAVGLFANISILPFDQECADVFHRLQDDRIRIGTMDLKIAAICLAHDLMLLTRNLVDFDKVPGLRVENWLD